jgi:thiamine transport system substrate-binding protein
MIKKLNILMILILVILILLPVSACNNDDSSISKDKDSQEMDTEKEKDNKIIVYIYSSFTDTLKDSINTHMANKYNTNVEFQQFDDTGPMVSSLVREKDNPKADVVIGIDNSFGLEILDEDVLIKYEPKTLKLKFDSLNFDKTNRLIPFDYGYVTLNYDSQRLEEIPQSYKDLLSKKYENRIAVMSPQTSSTGRIFFLETIARFGEEGYLDFWRDFQSSITNITSGWNEAYYGLYIQGESDMVVSYSTSPPVHIIFDETDKYKSLIIDDKAYMQIETVGIVKGSKNIEMAKRVVDYIISTKFQNLIPENQFMLPVNPESVLPDVFVEYMEIPKESIILDTDYVKENLQKWLSDWENVILE